MPKKQSKPQAELNQPEVIIDPKFQKLLPKLTPEEYKNLENDIMDNGCRDSLIVGTFTEDGEQKQYLIDGHNRYKICIQHGISYNIHEISFTSREEVILWAVENQKNRRNMTKFRWIELALNLYGDEFSKEGKEKQSAAGKGCVISHEAVNTLQKLGDIAKAGTQTVSRVKSILKSCSEGIINEDIINKLRMGDTNTSINSVYIELLNKDTKPRDISKIKLDSEESNKKLKKIFGNKLNSILTELEEFEKTLEKEKDRTKVNTLATAIKKIAAKV